jgi:hypothetical protein
VHRKVKQVETETIRGAELCSDTSSCEDLSDALSSRLPNRSDGEERREPPVTGRVGESGTPLLLGRDEEGLDCEMGHGGAAV